MNVSIKSIIRNIVVGLAILLTLPFWLMARAGRLGAGSFVTWGMFLSLFPGVLGIYLRRGYYVMTLQKFGWDSSIGFGSWFSKQKACVESRVSIGSGCILGMCNIGEGTLIGSNVDILSGRHQHGSMEIMGKSKDSMECFSPVSIGKNTWIGNRAVIMADVGDNSIVGAGSVVVHDVPANALVVGNPAVLRKNMAS